MIYYQGRCGIKKQILNLSYENHRCQKSCCIFLNSPSAFIHLNMALLVLWHLYYIFKTLSLPKSRRQSVAWNWFLTPESSLSLSISTHKWFLTPESSLSLSISTQKWFLTPESSLSLSISTHKIYFSGFDCITKSWRPSRLNISRFHH